MSGGHDDHGASAPAKAEPWIPRALMLVPIAFAVFVVFFGLKQNTNKHAVAAQTVPAEASQTQLGTQAPALQQATFNTDNSAVQTLQHPNSPLSPLYGSLPCIFTPNDAPSGHCVKHQAGSGQPSDTYADASDPKPGLTMIQAPYPTDSNTEADVNWSPWIRGHGNYTIMESINGDIIVDTPQHHDPRIKIDCWDVLTGSSHVITDQWCNGSAFRFQSAIPGQTLEMGYGFEPSARTG